MRCNYYNIIYDKYDAKLDYRKSTDNLVNDIKNQVKKLKPKTNNFYVGITDKPKRRYKEHINSNRFSNTSKMVILDKTNNNKIINVEKESIKYYKNRNKCLNSKYCRCSCCSNIINRDRNIKRCQSCENKNINPTNQTGGVRTDRENYLYVMTENIDI